MMGYYSPTCRVGTATACPLSTRWSPPWSPGVAPDRLEVRRRCREYASKYVGVQREEFKRRGVFGRWDKPYLT